MPADKCKYPIGITQGRLSPVRPDVIQYFPVDTWRREFDLARELGFTCIEWVYQTQNEKKNPLSCEATLENINGAIQESGVTVLSISGDIYMTRRLIHTDSRIDEDIVKHLAQLLGRAAKIGARHVMLPFVDGGQLSSDAERAALIELLGRLRSTLSDTGMKLYMETDWPAQTWASLLSKVNNPSIGVCYDLGDRASQGFDIAEDLAALSPWLGCVHIKDRRCGGTTVPLGTGDADLPQHLPRFAAAGYKGTYIIQASPVSDISPRQTAKRNLEYVQQILTGFPHA